MAPSDCVLYSVNNADNEHRRGRVMVYHLCHILSRKVVFFCLPIASQMLFLASFFYIRSSIPVKEHCRDRNIVYHLFPILSGKHQGILCKIKAFILLLGTFFTMGSFSPHLCHVCMLVHPNPLL